ncbi:MAG: hypothetical protein K2W93_09455, partial [Burkholderiaceae bacterium]|nr:hypothetical protein [Burkholderiaceae bacterium]
MAGLKAELLNIGSERHFLACRQPLQLDQLRFGGACGHAAIVATTLAGAAGVHDVATALIALAET